MKRLLLPLVFLSLISACASKPTVVPLNVTSEPAGASVDLNGIHAGITPFRTDVRLVKEWVGLLYSPDGWGYRQRIELTAFPPAGTVGSFQKKIVDGESLEVGGRIHFQFGTVTNVAPQEIDLNIKRSR